MRRQKKNHGRTEHLPAARVTPVVKLHARACAASDGVTLSRWIVALVEAEISKKALETCSEISHK